MKRKKKIRGFIYRATCLSTGKVYIGKSTKAFKWVLARHHSRGVLEKQKSKFYNAIRKYGWENFKWEILKDGINDLEELKWTEIWFISTFDSKVNGYNSTPGGDGGFLPNKMSEEQKRINGERIKNYALTIQKGKTFEELYGAERTKEIKEKAARNHVFLRGVKNPKISKALRGSKRTEEQKKHIRIALRKYSRPLVKLDLENLQPIKVYECALDAVKDMNITDPKILKKMSGYIQLCARHKTRSSLGFCWRYFEDISETVRL